MNSMSSLLLAGLLLATPSFADGPPTADEAIVVFLVRHAEKTGGNDYGQPRDPRLTEAGRARADTLARVLGTAGITAIHSTDYQRTRATAAPIAGALGLDVQRYDARMLGSFAERLRESPGRHLVVGHSNTTPELVRQLGGEPGDPMDEKTEYDRLYILVLGQEATTTIRQRYGKGNGSTND